MARRPLSRCRPAKSRICRMLSSSSSEPFCSAMRRSSSSMPASRRPSTTWDAACRCSTASSGSSFATRPMRISTSCPPELARPGHAVRSTFCASTCAASAVPSASREGAAAWIKEHVTRLQQCGHREEIQNLADGRVHPRHLRAARGRRVGRHAGGHHRTAAVRREDRMAGAPRHADRDPQPLPFPRAARASVRNATTRARASRCCGSISITSRRSTTGTAISSAMAC